MTVFMPPVPEHELRALKAMTGYDQLLELDRLWPTASIKPRFKRP